MSQKKDTEGYLFDSYELICDFILEHKNTLPSTLPAKLLASIQNHENSDVQLKALETAIKFLREQKYRIISPIEVNNLTLFAGKIKIARANFPEIVANCDAIFEYLTTNAKTEKWTRKTISQHTANARLIGSADLINEAFNFMNRIISSHNTNANPNSRLAKCMKYIELLQFSAEIKGADVVREKLATIIPRASPLTLNKSLMAIAHATESEESKMLVKACIGTFEYLREKNCYLENFITYVFAEDTQKLSSASIDRLLSILAK